MLYALVVTVILLGCAGLLIPAIGRVREAAGRSACSGHICQLSVAIQNYASANQGRLPTGTVANPSIGVERRLSWYVSVLPHMEADKSFKLIDLGAAADGERNRILTHLRFRNICCPMSGELKVQNGGTYDPTTGGFVYPGGDRAWKSPGPVTHYIGVAGVGVDAPSLDMRSPLAGVFGNDRRLTLPGDITDGTGNTMILFETALDPGHWAYGGRSTVRGIDPDATPFIGEGRPLGGFHTGSRPSTFAPRPSLAIIAMCDASIRTIGNDISPDVLKGLATANGHEHIP